jgi:Uma2 family endonuclease
VTLPAPRHSYTFEEYLAIEEIAGVRHEFYAGEIYAMAGGTPEHAAMSAAIILSLAEQLRGKPCRVYSSDLRVRVIETGLATYPDVSVVCGASERDPSSPTHVTNPIVVIEVASTSTAAYDRTEKRLHYERIASLRHIVIVDDNRGAIEVWTREPDGWRDDAYAAGDSAPLTAIGCVLRVDDVFAAARSA